MMTDRQVVTGYRGTAGPAGGARARAATAVVGALKRCWQIVTISRSSMVGCAISALVLLDVAVGPLLEAYNPERPDAAVVLRAPGWAHPFGTDASGFDVLSRTMAAPRVDITIALSATLLSIAVGAPLGVFSGYVRGRIGEAIVRLSDIVQSFPVFILAMALVSLTGQNIANLIFALAFLNTPIYLRLMRSQTLGVGRRTYVEASRTAGNSTMRTIFRHVLPNSLTPVFVQASVTVGWSILLVAGLSFVGAGVREPTPEWGLMISSASSSIITGQWWPSVFPGVAIAVSVLGFALVGVGLQQAYER
jgi:peptide/nickel transport system permease protein